jgi:predicted ATPase
MSELIGREDERAEAIARLGEGALVTLIGPGGAGKTRLASSIVDAPADVGVERALFCDLTEARTIAGVLGEVGRALGLELGAQDEEAGAAAIEAALSTADGTLLVLDNAEQVEDGFGELLGRWRKGSAARMLVTSRFGLGVDGEERVELGPMPADDARELFLQHAERARPGFSPEGGEQALIDDVLEQADHLPLAIELAAARLEILTLKDLRERLARGLDALAAPGDKGRHGAIRAVLEASWELLSDDERRGLARLSLFAGGFALDAAERVLEGGEGDPLDLLQALKRRSLLKAVPGDERSGTRFTFLEMIRRFAREKLDASEDLAEAAAGHVGYFSEYAKSGIEGRDFEGLSRELDNLVAAGESQAGAPADRTWALLGVDAVLAGRGPVVARQRFLEQANALADEAGDAGLQALIAIGVGDANRMRGDLPAAAAALQRAIELAAQTGDRRIAGRAKSALGTVRAYEGDAEGARASWEDALADLDAEGAALERAVVLTRLFGLPLSRGELSRDTEELAQEALDLFVKVGDRRWETIVRSNLGILFAELGDTTAASATFRRAIDLSSELGDRVNEGLCRANLGLLWLADGEVADAVGELEAARAIAAESGDGRVEGYAAGCLGIARVLEGDTDAALALLDDARRSASTRGDDANLALFSAWERAVGTDREVPEVPDGYPAIAAAVAILGGTADPGVGLHPRVAARFGKPVSASGLALVDEGLRFTIDGGEPVDLSRRGPLRRVLHALVDARVRAPGNALGVHDILDAGWPGEKVQAEAGANRVYTAIRQLRRMGLEDYLLTRDAGYLLDPEKPVREA